MDLIEIVAKSIEDPHMMHNEEFPDLIKRKYEALAESILKEVELPNEIKTIMREKTRQLYPEEIIEQYEKIVRKFLENDKKSHLPLPKKFLKKGSTSKQ